ncbi:MAG TPA: ArsC family reductase [Ferruginibacter sp.]|jgi:arsenate reductase|nr:ArsC family reductase [Ferruginibacter sp.]
MTIYGIPNCDTVKKTLDWFKKNKIDYEFHDYKRSGITKSKLETWSKKVGWETLLNKKGTSWRKLTPEEQEKVTNQTAAIKVMMENNSIIKRPVVEAGEKLLVGFNETDFIKQLK